MQDVFAGTELRIQRDGRGIREIGLHEDDVGSARDGDTPQFENESGGDPPTPVRGGDRQIVDVDLAALLLELAQLVGRQPAYDLIAVQGGERDEGLAPKQAAKI